MDDSVIARRWVRSVSVESVFDLEPVGVRLRLQKVAEKMPFVCDLIDYIRVKEFEAWVMYVLVQRREDCQYITYLVRESRDLHVGGYRTWFENGDYGFRLLSEAALDLERRAAGYP